MLNKSKPNIYRDFEKLLASGNISPYIFRTRLERLLYELNHSKEYSINNSVMKKCELIKLKLKCISDQSNQTPDGTLNSFIILEHDLKSLLNELN